MSNVEVDQSGKIERTQVNTALAFSDRIEASILILAVEKRECVKKLRQRGESGRTMYLKLFAAALFVLLKDYLDQIEVITVDTEYSGKKAEIRAMLLNHPSTGSGHRIWKADSTFSKERIVFRRVGKKSPAHQKALAVYRGEEEPDRKVRAREFLRLVK